MQLDIFKKATISRKPKRVGRGGKKGTYSGKGMKGQKSRAGFSGRPTFEGGKSSIVAVTKKLRGFKSLAKKKKKAIKLSQLEKFFKNGEEISPKTLLEKKLIKRETKRVKIISGGELKKKLVFKGVAFSQKAKELVEKTGSKVELVVQTEKKEKKEKKKDSQKEKK